jgi:CDP-6-deoxy-D-xylo-4-hexulose-3-dehydrase
MQVDTHSENFIPGTTRIKYGGAFTDKEDFDAIQSVLDRNWWTIDEHGKNLEKELSEFTKNKYAVLANSGSSALMIMYQSLGLPEGSEIITGAVQFPTAISGMYYNHLTPVFVDVEKENLSVDPDKIEAAISPKTKAILAVAIAGNIPNIEKLQEVAKKHNLLLLLDNCDGFGGTWQEEPIEKYFDASATSFHAAHILCMGEGGAVFTNNDEFGEKSMSLREWGRLGGYDGIDDKKMLEGIPVDYPARYLFVHMGLNVKPLELQCAMGRTQLKKLPKIKAMRTHNFQRLYELISGNSNVDLPRMYPLAEPSWFGFPLFAKNRPALRDFLEARQIETRTIFGGNITRQPAFRNFGRIVGDLTVADRVMDDGMFVSVHPSVTDEMIDYVGQSINEFYAKS